MKKKVFLYASIFLMGIAFLAIGMVYINDTRQIQPDKQLVPAVSEQNENVEITTSTAKKEDCDCCTERMMRVKEMIRRARERKQAEAKANERIRHENQTTK
ncbi:hypothetical protein F4Z99_11805 [Candidatus Poribacteria bacterium]|nr:hypothetical protein [Candidatus Poribacteria bacterium]MYA99171.1 hypothetical protein [Candidatus Poribacteria bacterium]